MSVANLNTETSRALTFNLGESLFGIDVGHILSFSDSFDEIKYTTDEEAAGFVGYLDFRNTLVRVFECATSLSKGKERDSIADLISKVKTFQQSYIDWMAELENSIQTGNSFNLTRDPKVCDFGKWYYSFETEDESLKALLDKIEQPHVKIYQLADKYLDMADAGHRDQALRELEMEKQTSLKKVLRMLDYITDFLNNSIHPIVLHLTKDGRTPWFSLVLDDIGDIIDYPTSAMDRTSVNDSKEPIEGYVRDKSGGSFMMLSLESFHEQICKKLNGGD